MSSNISMEHVLPRYITIQQASDLTGLRYYQLRKMVLENKVRYIKSGVKYLINEKALCEYLTSMEQEQ